MHPILFRIGQVNFYTHGLMIALGALVGGWVIYLLAKKEKLPTKSLIDLLIYSLFLGVIGARIAYLILYYYQFSNWHEIFYIWYGGLVSYGGMIGGFLAAGLILKKRRQNILKWFDLGVIGTLFGWSLGKIGCFLSGDIAGIASGSKIAIDGQIPVSLLESGWALVLAIMLAYLFIAKKNFLAKFSDGLTFFLGIGGYALGRFIIDFFRADNLFVLHLKAGQFASLVVLLLSIAAITYIFIKSKGASHARTNF